MKTLSGLVILAAVLSIGVGIARWYWPTNPPLGIGFALLILGLLLTTAAERPAKARGKGGT